VQAIPANLLNLKEKKVVTEKGLLGSLKNRVAQFRGEPLEACLAEHVFRGA
jgi:hypothetical protein